ncbi:dihydroorotase family protein [Nonomuraea sp. FMUSA5-5]|uniref:Dihydroorotase family protein n=1 Tax=Nonomuraea composti TaxID=2720023 RepID=A0ABX1BJU8_9ACTN|nr:dihydroorotase family protein [Nonomuraea sp. FMUSA5-5]NJP96061.1 dihydroorotase family protein [Nonomuraea sp. FMUSA5-5]
MPDADLLITGGTLVTSQGRRRADVAVRDGRVLTLDGAGLSAARTVDATGLLLLPGGVDTHVHLMDPGSTDREDFPSGTRAAAVSGVTTIIEHSHGRPVRTVRDLEEKAAYLSGRSNVDFALAAHAWPGDPGAVAPLWEAGAAFFKVFTCTTHGIPGHDAAALRAHLRATADAGAISLIHCEDDSLTAAAESVLRAAGREDPGILPEWRDRDAEVVAAAVAALLIRRTGARATVAHVSHPEVAAYLAAERARGARLYAETCPQYLLLREDEVHTHGPFRKFTPPARARHDQDEAALWRLLREGELTHVSSDHAPSTPAQKSAGGMWDVHFGLPGLDSTMAVLLSAAARGMLAYEDIARLYSEAPARIYGLWPRKGRIAPGADADLVLADPQERWRLRNEDVLSKAGWTPYDGMDMTGRAVATYLRGELIAEHGKPADRRTGRLITRRRTPG